LIADGAMPAGPPSLHEGTLYNVENFFGWTITTDEILKTLGSVES
jgi:hypothetical protein